jgi:hypothetical protein
MVNRRADAPGKTGMREQVSNEEQHQQIEQVLPREEST